MPTTYAHDLFGKRVYQKLNGDMQELILRHRTAYIAGLHGPDILFYVRPFHKNRLNQTGHRLHREEAAGFFERGKELCRATEDEGALVYLLGFVCHFMLDSTCHPYISEYMEKTGARHDEIETEFDRAMMEATGKNPFHYHPSHVIRATRDCVHSIAMVLDGVTEKEARHMLRAMRFYTDITVCPTNLKRRILLGLAKACGIYKFVQGRVIRRCPRPVCEESTRELKRLFQLAVPETAAVLEEYWKCVQSGEKVGSRFWRNYC